jgi:hybrid cluster-associated redox disulfide protein
MHYIEQIAVQRMAPMPDPFAGPIGVDMPVAEVMRRWPESVAVFLGRRMACPGCPMAPFMTLAEAARSYAIDAEDLIGDLRAVLPFGEAGSQP